MLVHRRPRSASGARPRQPEEALRGWNGLRLEPALAAWPSEVHRRTSPAGSMSACHSRRGSRAVDSRRCTDIVLRRHARNAGIGAIVPAVAGVAAGPAGGRRIRRPARSASTAFPASVLRSGRPFAWRRSARTHGASGIRCGHRSCRARARVCLRPSLPRSGTFRESADCNALASSRTSPADALGTARVIAWSAALNDAGAATLDPRRWSETGQRQARASRGRGDQHGKQRPGPGARDRVCPARRRRAMRHARRRPLLEPAHGLVGRAACLRRCAFRAAWNTRKRRRGDGRSTARKRTRQGRRSPAQAIAEAQSTAMASKKIVDADRPGRKMHATARSIKPAEPHNANPSGGDEAGRATSDVARRVAGTARCKRPIGSLRTAPGPTRPRLSHTAAANAMPEQRCLRRRRAPRCAQPATQPDPDQRQRERSRRAGGPPPA